MKRNSLIAVIVAAVVVLIGGLAIYALNQNKSDSMESMSASDMKNMNADQSSGGSKAETAAATNSVTIEDFSFSPKDITVKVGTTVTWTNHDSVEHNVVGDSDDGPNGPLLAKDESYSYTFKKAGSFDYHCSPHPYMKGTVTVTE